MAELIYKKLSYLVLELAFTVHNTLGPGLLESAYEGSFCIDCALAGVPFERQKVYPLYYKGQYVCDYIADLVVDNKIILEFKSVRELTKLMEAQIIHYLRLSHVKVGYLINFNSTRLVWKRFVNLEGGA